MKREIFLSFKPDFFRPILYGIKKYEYRKRFCKEEATAYLYLSAPIQEVVGVLELGIPIITSEIIKEYPKGTIIYDKIQRCIDNGEKFAIPIISLQLYKHPIPISKIKQLDESFNIPQCYLNICNYKKVYNYLKTQKMYDVEFFNDHSGIYVDNFGSTCKEMELTSEFNNLDRIYTEKDKYKNIKSGYLTKDNRR